MRLYLFHWASLRSIGDRCVALGSFFVSVLFCVVPVIMR